MATDFLSVLRDALTDFLAPLAETTDDPAALQVFLSQLGHTAAITGAPEVAAICSEAGALSTKLAALDLSTLQGWTGLRSLLQSGRELSTLAEALRQFGSDPARARVAEALGEEVLSLLLGNYLRRNHMTLFRVASVLTLINAAETSTPDTPVIEDGVVVRNSPRYDRFDFDQVSTLLSKPGPTLVAYYFPNHLTQGVDAWTAALRLFGNLGYFADALGISWATQYASTDPPAAVTDSGDDDSDDADDSDDPDDDESETDDGDDGTGDDQADIDTTPVPDSYYSSYLPTFRVVLLPSTPESGSEIALLLQCSSSSHPSAIPGYIVSVAGSFDVTKTFASWKLTLTSKGQIPALVLTTKGIELAPSALPLAGGSAQALLERLPDAGTTGPALVLGSADGTRLEVGKAGVEVDFSYDPAHVAAGISAKAAQCAFVISAGDGDGFLQNVLPKDGLKVAFDLGLGFSSDGGLVIQGGAGLDVTIPIGLSIAGDITIPSIHLALLAGMGGIQAEVSASAGLSIGPVAASLDRIGLLAVVTFPDNGGNLGPADLAFDFKPPSGVGLSVDAAGVSGGGFLAFDTAKHEYTGVLQLQFNDLALQAFGLITTQVAGGSGYSLLALVDANFPPVQLGWGFTLNGVGGLLAVHRSADTDKLRAALKADKLSSVLFPKSAISNAPLVLAQLDALFPTAAGRFLFGPMALIGWGTPTILTIALAVILEEPEPVRILLLARLAALLPSASAPLVRINMDALGVLDLSQSQLALDATLYDSKIMGFALSGDMALRANWGTQREFLLAIGGFHPQFTPPAGFPTLQRVTIDMPSGAISKLRLAAYLALTSNTVQFGANLDVFIGVSGFGLSGHLGFDALLQIDPFHFDADISGSVSLMADGEDLMSVGLDASLDGPAPWHIAGSFKIHFFFFDLHKSFSATWGGSTPALSIPPVQILPLLQTAFADARNWGASLPTNAPALVSLRTQNGATVVAHPLALLNVHQRLVPLDLEITRFGAAAISGATQFTITDFRIGGASVGKTNVQDDFAPAQFLELTDTEKLAGPSFERQDAGVSLAAIAARSSSPARVKQIAYETFYVDDPGGQIRRDSGQKQALVFTSVVMNLGLGASGRAVVWKAGSRRFAAPGKPVTVASQSFTITSKLTLQSAGIAPAAGTTYSTARTLLANAAPAQSSTRAQLQIVGTHEMAAV